MQRALHKWAEYFVVAVFLIAAGQLLGTVFNIHIFKAPIPDFRPMNPIAALGFILASGAFYFRISKDASRTKHIVSVVLTAPLFFGSIWRFSAHILKNNVKLPIAFPGQSLSFTSAICFVLTGIGLVVLFRRTPFRIAISHWLAIAIFFIALLCLFTNVYNAESFNGIFAIPMSFYAGICFLLLSMAILFAHPEYGLIIELTTPHAGSIMARRLIPAAVILPFLFGVLWIYGQRMAIYNTELGTALSNVTITITCIIFIYYNAKLLNRNDALKEKQDLKIKESAIMFSSLFYKSPVLKAIAEAPSGKYLEVNDAFAAFMKHDKNLMIGKTSTELNLFSYPEKREEILLKLKNDGFVRNMETEIILKNGTIRWVSTNIDKLNINGKDCYLTAATDITERKLVEEKLKKLSQELEQKVVERTQEINQLTAELRALLSHIQTSREEERKYIAREIHDELGSALTALKIDASMLQRKIITKAIGNEDYISSELSSIINQLDKSIHSVKNIATDLRPEILDHLGIIESVRWKAQQFENMTGVKCIINTLPDTFDLPNDISATVYRTIQEALTNIARHAGATVVKILIEHDANSILLEITDDGKGIDEEAISSAKSLGLIGMRERIHILNGSLSLKRANGKGTILTVTIPLLNE